LLVVIKISALSVGGLLMVSGLALMVSDLTETVRLQSVLATPHLELAMGAVFAMVGMSFLLPLLRTSHRG